MSRHRMRVNPVDLESSSDDEHGEHDDMAEFEALVVPVLPQAEYESLHRRLGTGNVNFSASVARAGIIEYCRFMKIKTGARDMDSSRFSPSWAVDRVWHTHLLDTHSYQRFCQRLLAGKDMAFFLHHNPDGDLDKGARDIRYLFTYLALTPDVRARAVWWPAPTAIDTLVEERTTILAKTKKRRASESRDEALDANGAEAGDATDAPEEPPKKKQRADDQYRISIIIKCSDGKTMNITRRRNSTVDDLLHHVADAIGMSEFNVRLQYDGIRLGGPATLNMTLEQLGMQTGRVVDCFFNVPKGALDKPAPAANKSAEREHDSITFTVKRLDSREAILVMKRNDTVRNLLRTAAARLDTPEYAMGLLLSGTRINTEERLDWTLAQSGIEDGSVIRCILNLAGC